MRRIALAFALAIVALGAQAQGGRLPLFDAHLHYNDDAMPAHPLEDVLAAGAPAAAATVHFVDEGVDTGPVIATEPVPVRTGDTVASLRERVHDAEHRLLPKVVRELCAR